MGSLLALLQDAPLPKPFIVKIIQPEKSELTGLADVLLGSLGLTGLIVVAAIVFGFVFGSVLFWVRSRR